MTDELIVRQPSAMIEMALQSKADLSQVEKLLELQERWDKNEARKAYHEAMAAFKADPPQITKDKTVSFGQGKASYTHASLANVTDKISKALSAQGLSASWKTGQSEDKITVTCTITHRLGHSESTSLSAAPDNSGSKNSIQAVGSTISYLERYTLLALTGLATHDMDNDGATADDAAKITPEQVNEIESKVLELDVEEPKFLKFIGVSTYSEILAKDYQKVMGFLRQKAAQKAKERQS